jgi:DHA2 family multidrug resistance protein-like MFS transporter
VLLRRLPVVAVMVGGLLVATVGFWLFTVANGLMVVVVASVVYSAGLAPVFIAVTDLMVGAAPESKAGAVASISETSNEFGGALGIAVLGSVTTLVYRQQGGEGDTLDAAAFNAGIHAVGWVSAAITVGLVGLALVAFRKVGSAQAEVDDDLVSRSE